MAGVFLRALACTCSCFTAVASSLTLPVKAYHCVADFVKSNSRTMGGSCGLPVVGKPVPLVKNVLDHPVPIPQRKGPSVEDFAALQPFFCVCMSSVHTGCDGFFHSSAQAVAVALRTAPV